MGASSSNLRRLVREEFTRLKGEKDFLVLDDVLEFQFALSGLVLDPAHLGVILAIDRDRDGRFPETELLAFASFVHDRAAEFQQYELQSMVHGRCMLDLWRNINTEDGLMEIVDWLVTVAKQNHHSSVLPRSPGGLEVLTPTDSLVETRLTNLCSMASDKWPKERDDKPRTFPHHPHVLYVHKNSLLGMHRILGNHGGHMQSFETFLNTLQRLAEERQLLELSVTALDDWVPEQVLRTYIKNVLSNMRQLVADMDVLQDLLHEAPN